MQEWGGLCVKQIRMAYLGLNTMERNDNLRMFSSSVFLLKLQRKIYNLYLLGVGV